jgi:hypothetical protein
MAAVGTWTCRHCQTNNAQDRDRCSVRRTASVAFLHMPAARLPADPPRHLGGGNLRKFVRLPDEQGQEVVK